MAKFQIGQKVRILTTSSTKHFGEIGEVVTVDDDGTCEVQFIPFDAQYFEPNELAPAAADAAPAPEAVALSHTAETLAGKLVSLEMRIAVALGLPDDEFLNGDHDHMLTCIENLVHNRNAEAARLREQVRGLEAALEPFAEAWTQNRLDPARKMAVLTPNEKFLWYELGITASALQDAHTAYFKLEPTPKGAE